MKWLEETHGVSCELVRHFLRRIFDGEWSSSPGQWKAAAIGAVSLLLPAGLLLVREGSLDPKYASRYRLLEMAADQQAIHAAALADQAALMTLLLCVTGLMALLQWQSLFPSGRDYLALASLPVRSRQIFAARFGSVALFSGILIATLVLLPSLIAPMEFGGGWRLDSLRAGSRGAGDFRRSRLLLRVLCHPGLARRAAEPPPCAGLLPGFRLDARRPHGTVPARRAL